MRPTDVEHQPGSTGNRCPTGHLVSREPSDVAQPPLIETPFARIERAVHLPGAPGIEIATVVFDQPPLDARESYLVDERRLPRGEQPLAKPTGQRKPVPVELEVAHPDQGIEQLPSSYRIGLTGRSHLPATSGALRKYLEYPPLDRNHHGLCHREHELSVHQWQRNPPQG